MILCRSVTVIVINDIHIVVALLPTGGHVDTNRWSSKPTKQGALLRFHNNGPL
jgi:hypothetical protein